jgi:hypothetical protein
MGVGLQIIKMKKVIYILLFGTFALSSCKKVCNCTESTGVPAQETRTLSSFDKIYVDNNVNVVLSIGPQQVTVEGGKNLLPNITTNVSSGTLTLKNTNICNWLRSYKKSKITVYVTTPTLTSITNNGVGVVSSADTLNIDSLDIKTLNAGDLDLIVKTRIITGHLFGPANLSLQGSCNNFFCTFFAGTGFVYCNNLSTSYTFLSSSTTGDCYVNVSGLFDVVINQLGNVYYTGNASVNKTIRGTGQLIHN